MGINSEKCITCTVEFKGGVARWTIIDFPLEEPKFSTFPQKKIFFENYTPVFQTCFLRRAGGENQTKPKKKCFTLNIFVNLRTPSRSSRLDDHFSGSYFKAHSSAIRQMKFQYVSACVFQYVLGINKSYIQDFGPRHTNCNVD